MSNLVKHVGYVENLGTRCVVVFREVPGEPNNCLVVGSDSLHDMYHEGLMKLVESDEGQQSSEIGELMSRRYFADGKNMLEYLHVNKLLQKLPAEKIILSPNKSTNIKLSEINKLVREQSSTKATTTEIVEEPAIAQDNANQMLARAEMLDKQIADLQAESSRLRDEAYSINPSLRPVKRGRPPKAQ